MIALVRSEGAGETSPQFPTWPGRPIHSAPSQHLELQAGNKLPSARATIVMVGQSRQTGQRSCGTHRSSDCPAQSLQIHILIILEPDAMCPLFLSLAISFLSANLITAFLSKRYSGRRSSPAPTLTRGQYSDGTLSEKAQLVRAMGANGSTHPLAVTICVRWLIETAEHGESSLFPAFGNLRPTTIMVSVFHAALSPNMRRAFSR